MNKNWNTPKIEDLKIAQTACPSSCEIAANGGACTPGHVGTNPNCPNCPYNPANQQGNCTDRLS